MNAPSTITTNRPAAAATPQKTDQAGQIQPYLFFNGRCAEAIEFYQRELGAQLKMLMRYKESPEPPPPGSLPPGMEEKVMHAEISIGGSTLLVSDGQCDAERKFEGFGLALVAPNEAEARKKFNALVKGGNVLEPLKKTFFSPAFGMVADKFGVMWMVLVRAETA